MSFFDAVIVQPIFNLLLTVYGIIPDFGVSIIILTIIVRLLLWPLVKKQLRQSKAMRKLQPELAKINKKYKNNPQMRSMAMLDLYKKHNVSMFGSIGILLVQMPILIAVYRVVQIFALSRGELGKYAYDVVKNLPVVNNLINNPDQFNQNFLGLIDLTKHAISQQGVVLSLLLLAFIAAFLQYLTSKQLSPSNTDSKRRLRDILAEAGEGKEADQSEINALVNQKMLKFMPIMTFLIIVYLPGALALYMAAGSAVGYIQNLIILNKDSDDMAKISNEMIKIKSQKSDTRQRVKIAKEAKITRIKAKE